MIMKAKHHWLIYPFFKWYGVWKTEKGFRPVIIDGQIREMNRSVLVLSNHFSWWDGFWAMYVNRKVFNRRFHFMMLEEQLKRYRFFNYTGGYSVRKGSRSVVESIGYTIGLLKNKENFVLLFPSGSIESMHKKSLRFEKGIHHILKNQDISPHVVLMACLIDYFSSPKPGLYIYLKEYQQNTPGNQDLEQAYNDFYLECVEKQSCLKK
jgi:hypothetical protein